MTRKKKIKDFDSRMFAIVFVIIQVILFGVIFGLPALVNIQTFTQQIAQETIFGKSFAVISILAIGTILSFLIDYIARRK